MGVFGADRIGAYSPRTRVCSTCRRIHLHPLGRNPPLRLVKVDLCPLGEPNQPGGRATLHPWHAFDHVCVALSRRPPCAGTSSMHNNEALVPAATSRSSQTPEPTAAGSGAAVMVTERTIRSRRVPILGNRIHQSRNASASACESRTDAGSGGSPLAIALSRLCQLPFGVTHARISPHPGATISPFGDAEIRAPLRV